MKQVLALAAALCALIALIFSPAPVLESARAALAVCAETIIPSLFPFFVVSILLNKLGLPAALGRLLAGPARRLFGVSGTGATALLIGLTGGYPLGAAYIAEMAESGAVEPSEAERLLAFCNNSGPAFLVGAMGAGVFSSARAGMLLYAAHALAALLSGLVFRRQPEDLHNSVSVTNELSFYVAFPAAVRQAVSAVLTVCGFVICFSVLVGLLDARGLFSAAAAALAARTGMENAAARALLTGFWELGSAAGAMQGLPLTPGNLALAAGLVGWGGLSVHCQTAAVLCDSELSLSLQLPGRLLSAGLGALLAWGLGALLL